MHPEPGGVGAHVANAGSMVADHSLKAARLLSFPLMQFNLVVSTLPGAFRQRQLGYVDALVMVQGLVEGASP